MERKKEFMIYKRFPVPQNMIHLAASLIFSNSIQYTQQNECNNNINKLGHKFFQL